MALTQLQQTWIVDVLGVDPALFAPSPGGSGAPAARAAAIRITVDNRSDRRLRFVKADNDGGRFDPAPPAAIAPGKKASFAVLDTGAKGGALIYQLEAKKGAPEEPDQLSWWQMSWKATSPGQLPPTESSVEPDKSGYAAAEAASKDAVAFMLTGSGAATAKAPATGRATPPARTATSRRRIEVSLDNQSDQWLTFWGADKMKVAFERKPPDMLKPGAKASFAIVGNGQDEIAFGLMYSILPAADTAADAATPKWTPHFTIPAAGSAAVPGSDIVPAIGGLATSASTGADAVGFVLSGKAAAPTKAAPAQGPEVRIPVTFTNDSTMVLRYWGADRMSVRFEQKPPELVRPGQSASFVVRATPGSRAHFGLMYTVMANETDEAVHGMPKWMPHFDIPPGEAMLARCEVLPDLGGLKAGGWPEQDGVVFALSGRAAPVASVQPPQAPVEGADVRIPITFSNDSNMVLRYWGADKMSVEFEQKPPELVRPGESLGFVVRGKPAARIHFGLMYSILPNETDEAGHETPKWTPHFDVPPGQAMLSRCSILPGVGGLKTGSSPEQDGVLFALWGRWVKDQELKTPVSIRNGTRHTLRLVASSAAPGRFDPALPVEIAAGATAAFASWARVASDQALVYELVAADGPVRKGATPRRWHITWHSDPGNSPRVDSKTDGIDSGGGSWGLDGDDGVRFELDLKDDAASK